jgi:hypothetical protein
MKRLRVSQAAVGILASLSLLAASVTVGEDGRDFAGIYDVRDVIDLGAQVGLTMTLEVVNYSGADVTDAIIALEDPGDPNTPYGFFPAVSILYRDHVRVSGSFTVPSSEYDSWQESGLPSLSIEFYDADGNAVERPIEIAPMIMEEV